MSTTSGSPAASRNTTPAHSPDHINDGSTSAGVADLQVPEEPLPEILKISKSQGADVLSTYYQKNPQGMYFSDFKEASAAIKHAKWQPPANDATIPHNNEQDRAIVRRLVEAFLDLERAMDTEGSAYRKRFTPGTTVYYNSWTIERCSWEILYMVKAMHVDGFKAPILDSDILKCIGQTEQWTFEERISMICRVVKISKSVAVSLMKHEKVWTTIGAPHKLYNSTLVNTQSNAYRNKWVKAGREADKANGEQLAVKRKRGSMSNTSRKSSATIVPSPLVNTFSTQSTPQQTNPAASSNYVSDAGAQPSRTPTSQTSPSFLHPTPSHNPITFAGNSAGNGGPTLPANMLPPHANLRSASHPPHSVQLSKATSAIDAHKAFMRAPLATTFIPQSASPFAVLAPPNSKINMVKLRAASAPTPTAARAPASAYIPAPSVADDDVEMIDAAPTQPEADSRSTSKTEIPGVSRPSVDVKPQVSHSVAAASMPTLSSTTAPASISRSAAEFDAAKMLLGLAKTEGVKED